MANAFTAENAPRDAKELANSGRFALRRLAEELQIIKDPATKDSFMSLDKEAMAAEILKVLAEKDSPPKKGRAPVEKKEEAPEEVAGGGEEEAPTPKRARAPKAATATPEASTVDLGPVLAAISALHDKVKSLSDNVALLNYKVEMAIGCSLKLAEEVMQAAPAEVLEVVKSDLKDVQDALGDAGK